MDCPKCGHVQADGPPECGRCGLIFARWVERRSGAPPRPRIQTPLPPDPSAGEASPLGLLLGSVAVLFMGLAAWHFWSAGGLPVDRDAWRDPVGGFAIAIPSGWTLVTPANSAQVLGTLKGRYPEAVPAAVRDGRSVAFFLPEEMGALAPWGSVTPLEGIPPPRWNEDGDKLAGPVAAVLASRLQDYRLVTVSVTEVDRLPALQVVGWDEVRYLKSPSQQVFAELPGGSRYPIGKTEDVWDTFERSLEHWLVAGAGRSFVLTLACPEAAVERHGRTLAQTIDSFRALKHPLLYGRVATPALRAAASVLFAAALIYTLTELSALRRKR